jgi:hypothetical protein
MAHINVVMRKPHVPAGKLRSMRHGAVMQQWQIQNVIDLQTCMGQQLG